MSPAIRCALEVKWVYPSDPPMINGMKMVESWTRGISDYTNNNGEATTYGVYVFENGNKFFTRGSLVAMQGPEARNLTATTVGPNTGEPARSPGSMEWHA